MEMSESSVYKRLISIMTSVPMDMLATPNKLIIKKKGYPGSYRRIK